MQRQHMWPSSELRYRHSIHVLPVSGADRTARQRTRRRTSEVEDRVLTACQHPVGEVPKGAARRPV